MAIVTTATSRPYVLLPSGHLLDLAAPDPASWTDEDLALGLARTYRWGGHSRWTRPLSVAQHSLLVLAIRECHAPIAPALARFELLHDAEEGLLGFDCIAPLKPYLGQPFAALCERLTAAVAERYELPALTDLQRQEHKAADRLAAASEAVQISSWTHDQVRFDLRFAERPLERDPLHDPLRDGAYAPWEPWPAEHSASRWLDELQRRSAKSDPGSAT